MTWATEQAREAVRDELAHTTIGTGYYSVTVGIDEAVEMAGAVLAALAPHVAALVRAERAAALREAAEALWDQPWQPGETNRGPSSDDAALEWVRGASDGVEWTCARLRDRAETEEADR